MTIVELRRACTGCIGRGCGTTCGICGNPIPTDLRRTPTSPSETRPDCPDCVSGKQHHHQS